MSDHWVHLKEYRWSPSFLGRYKYGWLGTGRFVELVHVGVIALGRRCVVKNCDVVIGLALHGLEAAFSEVLLCAS